MENSQIRWSIYGKLNGNRKKGYIIYNLVKYSYSKVYSHLGICFAHVQWYLWIDLQIFSRYWRNNSQFIIFFFTAWFCRIPNSGFKEEDQCVGFGVFRQNSSARNFCSCSPDWWWSRVVWGCKVSIYQDHHGRTTGRQKIWRPTYGTGNDNREGHKRCESARIWD